jgi:hypothetical protein
LAAVVAYRQLQQPRVQPGDVDPHLVLLVPRRPEILADADVAGDLRILRVLRQVRLPDFTGLEQAEGEAVAGGVFQAHDFGEHPGDFGAGRNLAQQFQRFAIEELDATRRVISCGDDASVLRDGAADAVAGLDDALDDLAGKQVDLAQPAVAAEHVGVARVA